VVPMPWEFCETVSHNPVRRSRWCRWSRPVNRELLGQLAPAVFDGAGNGKGRNHIRHEPVLAKNGVRQEAKAE
jgi:hypothetical protein